jgi:AraC-like DNA-binding protein
MKNNQIKNHNDSANLFLRKIVTGYFIIALIICACFTILYVTYNIKSFVFLMYIYTLQHILWLISFIYYKEISIDSVIKMYLAYALMIFYPITCIYWNSGNPVVFSWYLLIMIGAIVFDRHNMVLWITLTLLVVISIFFAASLFPHEDFTPALTFRANILTVIATIILASFFSIAFMNMLNIDNKSIQPEALQEADNTENLEKDKALYSAIIKYLEENKPFKNPDFNAPALANALNSNTNYISKAINAGGCSDFHTLLKNFRISYVKSMLDSGALKKYTIDYIYTEAGYRHRSTFNSAFKSIIGMTPSDYVLSLQNNDADS